MCYDSLGSYKNGYAIVAQLDRAFGSDNCDMIGFRLVFVRCSVIRSGKNAVVNGSQTTN